MFILLLSAIVYPYVVVHYTHKSVVICGFFVSIALVKLNDPEVYADKVIQFYEIAVEHALPELETNQQFEIEQLYPVKKFINELKVQDYVKIFNVPEF